MAVRDTRGGGAFYDLLASPHRPPRTFSDLHGAFHHDQREPGSLARSPPERFWVPSRPREAATVWGPLPRHLDPVPLPRRLAGREGGPRTLPMPVLDGVPFCQALDTGAGLDTSAMVAMTASQEAKHFRLTCVVEADDVLGEPFSLDALSTVVERHLPKP